MQSTASVHIFDMSKAVITCQSATQLIASLHICHMSKVQTCDNTFVDEFLPLGLHLLDVDLSVFFAL